VGVRPEDVEVSAAERPDAVRGTVASTLRLPIDKGALLTIRVGKHEVHARTAGDEHLATGDPVWLTFKRYHVFDRESGARMGAGAWP
jgi:ABC-type sugar transport system ATPase subunit